MASSGKNEMREMIEMISVTDQSLEHAVQSAIDNATAKARLITDIEIVSTPDRMEGEPLEQSTVNIRIGSVASPGEVDESVS